MMLIYWFLGHESLRWRTYMHIAFFFVLRRTSYILHCSQTIKHFQLVLLFKNNNCQLLTFWFESCEDLKMKEYKLLNVSPCNPLGLNGLRGGGGLKPKEIKAIFFLWQHTWFSLMWIVSIIRLWILNWWPISSYQ